MPLCLPFPAPRVRRRCAAAAEKGGKAMMDFIRAALPWLCLGVSLALCAANGETRRKAKEAGQNAENYMVEGMCFGMCIGLILGTQYASCGLLAGTLIGMNIRKKA